MHVDAKATKDFRRFFDNLPSQKKKIVQEKIGFLLEDPGHNSLNVHKVERARSKTSVWECYIDEGMQLLYESSKGTMILWHLGGHKIVDDVHLLSFSTTHFEPWKSLSEAQITTMKEPQSAPPTYTSLELSFDSYNVQASGTLNYFAYFRSSDLRILGVPEDLIQAVKDAPSLEQVLDMPELPEHVRSSLTDLSTSPAFEDVMFDSSRLLYRTTLDRHRIALLCFADVLVTDREGGRIDMQVLGDNVEATTGLQRESRKQRGDIVLVEPIQYASQTIEHSRMSAMIPSPNRCSTGLFSKYWGTR